MPKERKALIVHYTPGTDAPAAELDAHLADDWRIESATAMGGAAAGGAAEAPAFHFAALVVLEREQERSVRGFGPG